MYVMKISQRCCTSLLRLTFVRPQVTRCLSQSPKGKRDNAKSWISGIVASYERTLEKYAPTVHSGYMFIKDGVTDLKDDMKKFRTLHKEVRSGQKPMGTLSYNELMFYREAQRNMLKACVILFFAVAPFGFWIVAVMAFFPKRFMTSHFLTDKMKREAQLEKHERCVNSYPTTLHVMEGSIVPTSNTDLRDENFKMLQDLIIDKVEQGRTPSAEQILQYKDMFCGYPYGIYTMSLPLRYCLGCSWDNRLMIFQRVLFMEAKLIFCMDLAMHKAGVEKFTDEELIQACFLRGRNPVDLSREEQIRFLEEWTKLSLNLLQGMDEKNNTFSLLLYSAILMNFSHPANQKLMKNKEFSS